ncbi:ACT domain-containing protein [Haliangium ochraceum]|uniref:Uncharacterized protein n=1 Tax=Haliangium ochraceum (strain DSM 14365 / JCM 11303 / SMP-2) TaxID=502025 RepID=D0LSE5_HALO1|nr:ACT domain-containing protein [Haliangium ochraceum]ACY15644.1 conserved hypothetical protein [Haliangium ochraceum DSM 14365]
MSSAQQPGRGASALSLTVLDAGLAVCRLDAAAPLPAWAAGERLLSITRTPDELSIVCDEALAPAEVRAERGFRALVVHGPLAFQLTGVLLALVAPLAEVGVSIFALSTFDTDYVLVRASALPAAVAALRAAGHEVQAGEDGSQPLSARS